MATELTMESDFPEISENIWDKVASSNIRFKDNFNEGNVFDSMYNDFVTAYYAEATDVQAAGRQVLDLFQKWKAPAREFTKYVLRGDADDPLDATLNWDAEGGGEAIIRPITTHSTTNASYTQVPAATGQFNIFPDENAGDGVAATATANQQAWMVFGYMETVAGNKVPYDYTQANVNDEVGTRRQFWLRNQMDSKGTLKVAERSRGPLLVEPGFDLDIDANVHTTGIETGLFPLGIEIIRADSAEYGGVLD